MDTAAFGITCNAICPAWTDTPRKFLCLRQERELFYFMRELCENFLHIYKEDDIFNVKSSFDQYCSVYHGVHLSVVAPQVKMHAEKNNMSLDEAKVADLFK